MKVPNGEDAKPYVEKKRADIINKGARSGVCRVYADMYKYVKDLLDTNNDGVIDLEEFKAIAWHMETMAK